MIGYAIYRLNGFHYEPAGGAYDTVEEAMEAIDFHFRKNPAMNKLPYNQGLDEPPIILETFGPVENGWHSRLVEVRPDRKGHLCSLAVYKMLQCKFSDIPPER
jgi:hypothetical protein